MILPMDLSTISGHDRSQGASSATAQSAVLVESVCVTLRFAGIINAA
jgi:hypothetical protein